MNKGNSAKIFKHLLIPTAILTVSILSFYIVSYIYAFGNKAPQTVILNRNLFDNNQPDKKEFAVAGTSKLDLSYSVCGLDVLDDDLIALSAYNFNINSKFRELYTLSFSQNKLSESYNKNGSDVYGIDASPDGKKILCLDYSVNYKNSPAYNKMPGSRLIIYDMQTKKTVKTFDNIIHAEWLPDSSGFIGIDMNKVFLQDLISGQRNDLLDTGSIYTSMPAEELSPQEAGQFTKYLDIQMAKGVSPLQISLSSFKISRDGNQLYFMFPGVKSTTFIVYTINQGSSGLANIRIGGTVNSFAMMNNGNILFNGSIDGNDGMFIYNVKSKIVNNIAHGNIYVFDISPDNKELAYAAVNNSGTSELYAAYLDNDGLESVKTVYRDQKYLNYLAWSRDGQSLFATTSKLGGSLIYKYSFKYEE
jgi:hypothetical protein